MKKFLSILLCLAMLVCMFVACDQQPTEPPTPNDNGDTPTNQNPPPAEVRLRLIFPDGCSDALEDAVIKLKNAMVEAGMNPLMVSDEISDNAANTDAEILVGETNRPASTEYLAGAPENAYTVRAVGNKTVLAGGSDALTIRAIEYFIEHYIKTSTDGSFTVTEAFNDTLNLDVRFLVDGETEYKIAYQKGNATLADLMPELQKALRTATGKELPYSYAPATYAANAKQILVGVFDYEEAATVNTQLRLGGYAIAVTPSKIYLAASDANSYSQGFAALSTLLKNNTNGTGAKRTITLADGHQESKLVNKDLAHMPTPSAFPAKIIQTADNAGWTAVYQRCNVAFFNDYCAKLESAGFTKYAATNFHGDAADAKNYFATYLKDTNVINISFHENNDRLYLTTTSTNGEALPMNDAGNYTDVTSKYPIAFVQVGEADLRSANSSMCFIMRMADGSFVIIDGNREAGSGERIYRVLKKLAPNPNNIVISAWIMTHAHGDHFGGYKVFMESYKNDNTITLKRFIHNFPAAPYASDGSAHHNTLINLAKAFDSNVEIIRVHAGNVLHFPGAKFNVLYTQDEYLGYQDAMLNYNASSVVMQIVMDDGSKILVGADHPVQDAGGLQYGCEQAIWRWYGSFIQSDMVTTFHHGLGGGADGEVYAKIAPKIVFWCCDLATIQTYNLAGQGRNQYFKKEGVTTYVSDDNIHIAYFEKGEISVVQYNDIVNFLGATVK